MPWYHFQVNHGPGHQSSDERYQYFEKPLTKAEEKMWFDEYFHDLDWPSGTVKAVRSLPEHILADKIATSKGAIKRHRKLLAVLETTPGKPVIAVHIEFPPLIEGKRAASVFRTWSRLSY